MRIAAAIFGISAYEDDAIVGSIDRLHYAADDAVSFKRYVEAAYSFASEIAIECFTDSNATFDTWSSSIDRLSSFKPDTFIVYLSGHAIRSEDSNSFFCLADTSGPDSALDIQTIDHALARVGAETSLLFLDCCYAEAIVEQSEFFRSLCGDQARIFLCSARSNQRAWEDSSIQHGLFSNALIRGLADISPLADQTGFVDIDDLFTFVSQDVSTRAFARKERARQEPVKGGLRTSRLRLPTASANVLGSQISTYKAVAISFRRWLIRASVLVFIFVTISDLAIQHLQIRADGSIVVHSGLPIFDPLRRMLPGGIVDTGFDNRDLDRNFDANKDNIKAIEARHLMANRLWKSSAWPTRLGPALTTEARQSLSILLNGSLDRSAIGFDPNFHAPPISSFVALFSLSPRYERQTAEDVFSYALPEMDLKCGDEVDNRIDFPSLLPNTSRFIKELDWRLATPNTLKERQKNFDISTRIVAYRSYTFQREEAQGTNHPQYDAVREFRRLADWAQSLQMPTGSFPIGHIGSWCSLTHTFLSALGRDPEIAVAGEENLLKILRHYKSDVHGDVLPERSAFALSLLAIVAQHRPLNERVVDTVSALLRNDDRGLDGAIDIVNWLEKIAPSSRFPNLTRNFLLETLKAPLMEHDFRQLTAFRILSGNAKFLTDRDRNVIVQWAQQNFSDNYNQDMYAEAVSLLAQNLPPSFVSQYVKSAVSRTDPSRAVEPPERTWRGSLLISTNHVPEWTAISRIGQSIVLPLHVTRGILTFALVFGTNDFGRDAVLALAHQIEEIRENDWNGFRQRLVDLAAEEDTRDVLSQAAGMNICNLPKEERARHINLVREIWSKEKVPFLRISLAKTVQYAALCALTK